MTWAAELLDENPAMARAEAEATARALEGTPVSAGLEQIQLALTVDAEAWANRLGLAQRTLFVEDKTPVETDAITSAAQRLDLDGDTFSIVCRRLVDDWPEDLVERTRSEVEEVLAERARPVDEDADTRVVVLMDREAIVGTEAAPCEQPATAGEPAPAIDPDPRIARAMVNLTEIPANGRLWVPFAGHGPLAGQGALVGADTLASDPDAGKLDSIEALLESLDATGAIAQGTAEDVADAIGGLEGIATIPPSQAIPDEDAYRHLLACAAGVLRPGRRLVIAVPDPALADAELEALREVDRFENVAFGESSRTVLVLERKRHG